MAITESNGTHPAEFICGEPDATCEFCRLALYGGGAIFRFLDIGEQQAPQWFCDAYCRDDWDDIHAMRIG